MTAGIGPVLELEFKDKDSFFVEVGVTVDAGGFAGHSTVFIRLDALEAFARGVTALDETRRGSTPLESAEPVDFCLQLFSMDRAGHVGLRVEISRRSGLQSPWLGEDRSCDRVVVGFQMESTGLSSIASWSQQPEGILRISGNRT